ncbi:MAG: SDR family oxidoreductase [Pseudomonadota bacterium]
MTDRPLALVTGAARGIGRAAAEALAADGKTVLLADIDADAVAATGAEIGATAHAVDISDPEAVCALFDRIEADTGPVTTLVNNAGIALPQDFLTTPVADFRRVIDLNLTGAFVATQRAAQTMVAKGLSGAIVNVSSINAIVAIPSIAAYCASKGGINQLTRATSLALAPHNIRVNAVGPGSIDTAMLAGINADPEALARVLSRTPLKRIGSPSEVGDLIAFLASEKSSYITGETIYIDGGRLGLNYTC